MFLEKITWKQAEGYFKEKDIAIIPVGSTENHGSRHCHHPRGKHGEPWLPALPGHGFPDPPPPLRNDGRAFKYPDRSHGPLRRARIS